MNNPPAKSRRQSLAQPSSPPVNLSEDLIFEVLSFLTVKLLLRFRCVCKSWNALISNPSFIKNHQKKSEQNKQIIRIEKDLTSIVSKCLIVNSWLVHGFVDEHYCRLTKDDCRLTEGDGFHVVGSCNGLVCLISYKNKSKYWFYFYNPATRRVSEKLGSFRRIYKSRITFGFDNSTDTYKVVEFCQKSRDVRVFSLGDNIWRKIQSFPNIFIPNKVGYSSSGGVYLSGTLNWLVFQNDIIYDDSRKGKVNHYAIISLDLGIETYTKLLPPGDSDEVLLDEPSICVFMDCLCFCHYYFCMGAINLVIWKMMNSGGEKSWSKFLNFNHSNLQILGSYFLTFPLCQSENGGTLMLANRRVGQLILYNLKTNKVERIIHTKGSKWIFFNNYVESLVSTNGK